MKYISIIICIFLFLSVQKSLHAQPVKDVVFVCPPCGCSDDGNFFDEAGTCDACGMTRVATYEDMTRPQMNSQHTDRKKVAIFIFDGVQIIDYTGPYEVFGQAGWEVYTVAESVDAISTSMNMTVVPSYDFENVPQPDILVLPGGGVNSHYQKKEVISWIKKMHKGGENTLSVCNGAFFLGQAGLLNGKKATTFAALIPALQSEFPEVEVVDNERFVDNGNIITSAGLSSGIDGALHVVSKYYGVGRTQEIATNLEYEWDPEGGYVRAALADYKLAGVRQLLYQFENYTVRFEGTTNEWTSGYEVKTDLSLLRFYNLIHTQLEKVNGWKPVGMNNGPALSNWKIGEGEMPWNATVSIDRIEGGFLIQYHVISS